MNLASTVKKDAAKDFPDPIPPVSPINNDKPIPDQ